MGRGRRPTDGQRVKIHRRSALHALSEGLESLFGDGKHENVVDLDLYYRVRHQRAP